MSTLAWGLGAALFHVAIGAGYANQVARIEGGAAALGGGLEVAARAMQVVRWPAEQLATFGGYITYHNVLLLWFFLGLWAALSGVRVTRGEDAERGLELVLATGRSRVGVLASRTAGFTLGLVFICLVSGGGLAAATALAGATDVPGALLTSAAAGVGALVFYALGLLAAQLAPSRPVASGGVGLLVTALYVTTNAADLIHLPAWLLWLSPFHHLQGCRALLAGRPFELSAVATLATMALGAWILAALAFSRRDLNGPLFAVRSRARPRRPVVLHFRPYWVSELLRGRWRLLGWALGSAALGGLLVWLEPEVSRLLKSVSSLTAWIAAAGGSSLSEQYLSFAADTFAPLAAAFAVTHAGLWAAEVTDGRLALMLSQPISVARLVAERAVVLLVGAGIIVGAGLAGMALSAQAVGLTLNGGGVLRVGLLSVLLVLAVGGVGALLAWVLRGAVAVTALGSVVALSYLLLMAVPLLDLPAWVGRLSFFGAFGHPYAALPAAGGLVFLAVAAVGGLAGSALVATRAARV